jgi:predicted alpha/beta superfamily hydrolase
LQKKYSIIKKIACSKNNWLIFLLCITANSFAQFTLQIEIIKTPSNYMEDGVFAAGTFNSWNPSDSNFIFFKQENKLVLKIKNLAPNTYQFKFTRGSWQKVECTNSGKDIDNKSVQLHNDTTIQYVIEGWKDDFIVEKKHTASANVKIIDTAFFMPQLQRYRKVWMYLPSDYKISNKKYPVMYMHDGQNLFDNATSGYGEWGVDECIDSLIAKGKPGCIIVGIDNGGQTRMNEYNPYDFTLEGGSYATQKFLPQGNEYIDFITLTLKPFIDKHYRTLPSKENTIIAGSSMGGLISYYATLKYPEVYGKAGIFSPAFWTAPSIKLLTDSVANKINAKFFFYMGEQEGDQYIADMNEVAEKLATTSNTMIYLVIDAEGKHNETAWHKWFAEFYNWIMADGYNNVIKLE